MCGITGFATKVYNKDHLKEMTDSIAHRGPDAAGYFFDPNSGIGLGHRRLSILDLSEAANQPMTSHDERYVMVYNGEVYNFQDIQKKYDITTTTSSDSEIILELFVRKGIDALQDFNGMFAIAIWDKEQKKLYLIRDRMGVKPIFYYFKDNNFAFASETKALFALPIERKLNLEAIGDYLFLESIPAPLSAIKDIYKLRAGHYLVYDTAKCSLETHQYYNLLDKLDSRQQKLTDEQYQQEFEKLFADSIKLRQISDVPVGAFLSGGTDSTLVCHFFQESSPLPIKTFNIGFDVASHDESKYATEAAEILKTQHQLIKTNDKEALSLLKNVVAHYDEPFAAPSTFPSMLVCSKAREQVTVALSGDGGDELFMGYGHYQWYNRFKKIEKFSYFKPLLIKLMKLGSNRTKRAAEVLNCFTDNWWLHIWSQEQYMFSEKDISKLLNTTYTHQTLQAEWKKIDALPLSPFEKISLFDIKHYLADNLLYKMDIASMAYGLEVRLPFLDYRLVEMCVNLPIHLKTKDGVAKVMPKKILEREFSKEFVHRKKWGFPAPLGTWLKGELKYLFEEYLSEEKIKRQGLLNFDEIDKLRKRFEAGEEYHFKRLWSLLFLQMWIEHYDITV